MSEAPYFLWSSRGLDDAFIRGLERCFSELGASYKMEGLDKQAEIFSSVAKELNEVRDNIAASWNGTRSNHKTNKF